MLHIVPFTSKKIVFFIGIRVGARKRDSARKKNERKHSTCLEKKIRTEIITFSRFYMVHNAKFRLWIVGFASKQLIPLNGGTRYLEGKCCIAHHVKPSKTRDGEGAVIIYPKLGLFFGTSDHVFGKFYQLSINILNGQA